MMYCAMFCAADREGVVCEPRVGLGCVGSPPGLALARVGGSAPGMALAPFGASTPGMGLVCVGVADALRRETNEPTPC